MTNKLILKFCQGLEACYAHTQLNIFNFANFQTNMLILALLRYECTDQLWRTQ